MENNIEIFLSYAREDEKLAKELVTHLSILKRQGLITAWYDSNIVGGVEWPSEISSHLDSAQIILLLISPNFLDSYSKEAEINRAIERHRAGEARVILVLLRPTTVWKYEDKFQVLPTNGKPVTKWIDRDLAFFDVATGIRKVVKALAENPHSLVSSPTSQQALSKREMFSSDERFSKLKDLENNLRTSYSFIQGYEDILRISDDPKKKAQAQQSIEKQSNVARDLLNEYQQLTSQLGVHVPTDITQIAAQVGAS